MLFVWCLIRKNIEDYKSDICTHGQECTLNVICHSTHHHRAEPAFQNLRLTKKRIRRNGTCFRHKRNYTALKEEMDDHAANCRKVCRRSYLQSPFSSQVPLSSTEATTKNNFLAFTLCTMAPCPKCISVVVSILSISLDFTQDLLGVRVAWDKTTSEVVKVVEQHKEHRSVFRSLSGPFKIVIINVLICPVDDMEPHQNNSQQ